MKLNVGEVIAWMSTTVRSNTIESIGIVTKKASRGYWVLWGDGSHKILPKNLIKYTRVL